MPMIWTNELIAAIRIASGRRAFSTPKTTAASRANRSQDREAGEQCSLSSRRRAKRASIQQEGRPDLIRAVSTWIGLARLWRAQMSA